jgi:rubrerythrin
MTHAHIPEFSTIEEILQYAIQEEKDAYDYYMEASERIADPDMKRFLLKLASMEIEHYNTLKEKLEECRANHFCSEGIMSSFSEEF